MKKILIIGKRSFIANNLYKNLNNKFKSKLIQFNQLNSVKKNIGIGIDYLYKAAWQDQVNAMTTLGWESFTGKIMNKNDKEAFDWNKKASDLGFTIASYNLQL